MRILKLSPIVFLVVSFFAIPPHANLQTQERPAKSNSGPVKSITVAVKRPGNNTTLPSSKEVDDFLNQKPADPYYGKNFEAKRSLSFKTLRKLLMERNLPFDPSLFMDKDWRGKISQFPAFTQSLTSTRLTGNKMSGVILADNLYLPEKMALTGDTVIVANRIYFEGANVSIKGPYKIALFPIDTMVSTNPLNSDKQYKLSPDDPGFEREFLGKNPKVSKGKITIDTSGQGSNDKQAPQRGSSNKSSENLSSMMINHNGAWGAPGSFGAFRNPANKGEDSPDPIDGSCINGEPNGRTTPNAKKGGTGDGGGDAPDYDDPGGPTRGQDASPIELSIPPGSADDYQLLARGGTGGPGGQGGRGGDGGPGGDGKRGGNGAACGCAAGNGGKGGDAGEGGDGGLGGGGGDGAPGGSGADAFITKPAGYYGVLGWDLNRGDGGNRGPRGDAGNGGKPGRYGIGGNPGPTACGIYGNGGDTGNVNNSGGNSGQGLPGSAGPRGDRDGQPHVTQIVGTGGGGAGGGAGCRYRLDPGIAPEDNCGCTDYWWVEFVSFDGGNTWTEIDSWYAGCFTGEEQ